MNIIGTVYLVDEPHIDILKAALMNNPPPDGRIATGSMLCMDMDEANDMLEIWFPNHCQKATLLCPPPIAMYKEIDGDQEGFIEEYNRYLDHEESVQDFLASMLLFLHLGGNIMLYSPSYLEDDAIWIQTLVIFFFTRFGITIGTPTSSSMYDQNYDAVIADFLYSHGIMNVMDYINSCTSPIPSVFVQDKIIADLLPFCGEHDDPLKMFTIMKQSQLNGKPLMPAISFDR